MAKLAYTLTNPRSQIVTLRELATFQPNVSKVVEVEEDSEDERLVSQAVSDGLLIFNRVEPVQSAYGPRNTSPQQDSALRDATSGSLLSVALNGANKLWTVSRAGGRSYIFTDPDPTHEVVTANDGAVAVVTKDLNGRVVSISGNWSFPV